MMSVAAAALMGSNSANDRMEGVTHDEGIAAMRGNTACCF